MNATTKKDPINLWFRVFRKDPFSSLDDLLRGLTRLPLFERATPSEILKRFFGMLPKDNPDLISLDENLRIWIDDRVHWPIEQIDSYGLPRFITETMDALATVWLIGLPQCRSWIQENYITIARWSAPLKMSREWDLPRSLAQAAALTQNDKRLRFYWMRMCKEASRPSERNMIDPALTGLAVISELSGHGPDQNLIAGLARFGEGLKNKPVDQADFIRRWRALKVRYPRTPKTWRRLWRPILEDQRFESVPFRKWLLESDPPLAKPFTGSEPIPAIPYHEVVNILKRFRSGEQEEALWDAKKVLDIRERYAEATGDPYFFVTSACNFGKEIVEWAPGHALAWSRAALQWSPSNPQAWSLRGTALLRLGRIDLAQAVYWEAARRLPDNAVVRNQLALIMVKKGYDREAEALFREAGEIDPSDQTARVELAHLLARKDRKDEAEEVLRQCVVKFPNNMIPRYTLALYLIAWGRPDEAIQERNSYINRFGQDQWIDILNRYLEIGESGQIDAKQHLAARGTPGVHEASSISADKFFAVEQTEIEESVAEVLERMAAATHADLLFRIHHNEDASNNLKQALEQEPDALYPEVVWALHDQARRSVLSSKYQQAFGTLAPHLAAAGPETPPKHWERLRHMFPERHPIIDYTFLMRSGYEEAVDQRLSDWIKNDDENYNDYLFLKKRLCLTSNGLITIDPQAPEQISLLNSLILREVSIDEEVFGALA